MHARNNRGTWNVRALLETTATPFAITDHAPRAAIYQQGDPCDSVMHIERGRVWLTVRARNGKRAICGLLGPGAFLGDEALVDRSERSRSATAMTAAQVLVIAKADMAVLLATHPGLLDRFVAHLLARNTRLQASLSDQLLYSCAERLAHALLVLANCRGRRPRRYPLPDVPQETIAEMVGSTRSRVNRHLSRFKKLGFLEEHRGVLHVNPARLHVVRDGGRQAAIMTSAMSNAPEPEETQYPAAG